MPTPIQIIEDDITHLSVDAIVNAANTRLLGGGGVDGAIHRAAGPALLDECRALPEIRPGVRCPTGQARITRGHNLPARFIIHTVGPVWNGGGHDEDRLLADCYRNSLQLAADNRLRSIAFPAISTGAYGFPMDRAAHIAAREVRQFLQSNPDAFDKVLFVCFGQPAVEAFEAAVSEEGA